MKITALLLLLAISYTLPTSGEEIKGEELIFAAEIVSPEKGVPTSLNHIVDITYAGTIPKCGASSVFINETFTTLLIPDKKIEGKACGTVDTTTQQVLLPTGGYKKDPEKQFVTQLKKKKTDLTISIDGQTTRQLADQDTISFGQLRSCDKGQLGKYEGTQKTSIFVDGKSKQPVKELVASFRDEMKILYTPVLFLEIKETFSIAEFYPDDKTSQKYITFGDAVITVQQDYTNGSYDQCVQIRGHEETLKVDSESSAYCKRLFIDFSYKIENKGVIHGVIAGINFSGEELENGSPSLSSIINWFNAVYQNASY